MNLDETCDPYSSTDASAEVSGDQVRSDAPESSGMDSSDTSNGPMDNEEACTPLTCTFACTAEGLLYLYEAENPDNCGLTSEENLVPNQLGWPPIRRLSFATTSATLRYRAVDTGDLAVIDTSISSEDGNRILLCVPCNLSFAKGEDFTRHVGKRIHDVELSSDQLGLLETRKNLSAILLQRASCDAEAAMKSAVTLLVLDENRTEMPLVSQEQSTSTIPATMAEALERCSVSIPAPYCNLHPDGKVAGVECPKCDLILGSSRSLGGHMTMMHSRNSCKTLKCPKCNWHYKYQETLEIHMKEKHSDAPTTCPYCVSNTQHPRLGRGEQWSCGYKPFRCELCKYSTTTKGNLAIHMQSDKHLNNVQEVHQQSEFPNDSTLIGRHATPTLSDTDQASCFNAHASSTSPTTSKACKTALRCDLCNYETNVARNLRIHMTSEKHAANLHVLQRSVKQYQQHSFPTPDFLSMHHAPPPSTSTYSLTTSGSNLSVGGPLSDDLNASIAISLQNSYLHKALDKGKMFQCCVCMTFVCDSLDDLTNHCQNVDRSRTNDGDISATGGNYLCNLCNYKTHLKANFQLHTKTDKHLQKLQFINHVREGGAENELRTKYLNLNNPIQLRCVACNEYANSFHKMQTHVASTRHKSFAESFRKIALFVSNPSTASMKFYCALCDYAAANKHSIYAHIHSEQHNEIVNQFLPIMEASAGVTCWIELRANEVGGVDECEEGFESGVDNINNDNDNDGEDDNDEDEELCNSINNNENDTDEASSSVAAMNDGGAHCCSRCDFITSDFRQFRRHSCSRNNEAKIMQRQNLACPLCQIECGSATEALECHLSQIHNVSSESIQRLLSLLPSTSDLQSSIDNGGNEEPLDDPEMTFTCPVCAATSETREELYAHQFEACHAEVDGALYACWYKGCKVRLTSAAEVKSHFRDSHWKTSTPGCVTSDKHLYKYRCTQCTYSFITEEKLREHQQYHVIRAATKCAICARTFRTTAALKRHVELTHVNLNAAELQQYKAHLMGNDDGEADDEAGPLSIDLGTNDEAEDKGEELLNTSEAAFGAYNDSSRKFKCHRCKMAFTKQSFLSLHNRTLQHRKGEKSLNYNIERYHDPSRPFKCEICKESFTQKSILLVHLNSVLHLHKMKKANASSPEASSMINGKLTNNVAKSLTNGGGVTNLKTPKAESSSQSSKDSPKPFHMPVTSFSPSIDNSFAAFFQNMKSGFTNGAEQALHANTESQSSQVLTDKLAAKKRNSNKESAAAAAALQASYLNSIAQFQQQQQSAAALMQMAQLAPFFDSLMPGFGQTNVDLNAEVLNERLEEVNRDSNASSPQTSSSNLGKSLKQGRGTMYRRLLQDYGFEVVMQYNESSSHHKKRSKSIGDTATNNENELPVKRLKLEPNFEQLNGGHVEDVHTSSSQQVMPEIGKSLCTQCGKSFSSVWVLKAHNEQVHKQAIPMEAIEKLSEEFKEVYEKKAQHQSQMDAVSTQEEAPKPQSNSSAVVVSASENVKPKQQQQQQLQQQQIQKHSTSAKDLATLQQQQNQAMAAAMNFGLGMQFPFVGMPFNPFAGQNPFMPMMMPSGFDAMNFQQPAVSVAASSSSGMGKQQYNTQPINSMASTPMLIQQQQKRARTRITDEQLKVLREYFDINNSPSEEQIEQMSRKSGLPLKVIKHWFRNTLFKERQRSKDSPYNFNIPPTVGIDLEEYEKTGEAKVISLDTTKESLANAIEETAPTSSTTIEINCGEPVRDATENAKQQQTEHKVKYELPKMETFSDDRDNSFMLGPIKEELMERSKVEGATSSEEHNDDYYSGDQTPNLCESPGFLTMSAQETLRRLTSVLPALQMPFRSSSPNSMVFLNHKTANGGSGRQNSNSYNTDLNNMIAGALSPNAQMIAAGRRANRTRFTEGQVKALQDFFEKNAYPKDDDLENLSKRLSLSPRVIVVWFQNARQKARKVYENLPPENDDRFLRTPGLNYQCKKCNLVFQRYYELIKHQKSLCFKDENQSMLKNNSSSNFSIILQKPNGVESLTDEEYAKLQKDFYKCDACNIHFNGPTQFDEHLKVHANNPTLFGEVNAQSSLPSSPSESQQKQTEIMKSGGSSSGELSPDNASVRRQRTQILPEQLELLYGIYKQDPKPSVKILDQISQETGLSKRVVQVWFQNTRMRERRGQQQHLSVESIKPTNNNNVGGGSGKFFNKRCPFCGILFHSKLTMESHMNNKHPSQYSALEVNIDGLPNAEEVPTITTVPLTEALWNALGSTNDSSGIHQSMLGLGVSNMSILPGTTTVTSSYPQLKTELSSLIERVAAGKNAGANGEETPLDLSRSIKQMYTDKNNFIHTEDSGALQTPNNSCYSNDDDFSYNLTEDDDMQSICSQDSTSPHQQVLAALTRPQKRFRTHLTMQQIKVMKHLFNDFKTPSMAECEALGNEVGLYKRVVQVWFQNARAKERKVKVVGGIAEEISPEVKPTPTKCFLCNVPYSGRISMQDHCFSKGHIDKIKQTVDDSCESGGGGQYIIDVGDERFTRTPVNGQSSSKSSSSGEHSTTNRTSYASHDTSVAKLVAGAQKHSDSPQPAAQKKSAANTQDAVAAMVVAQNLLPFMCSAGNPAAAYYASMMMPAGFSGLSNGGLFYDPNLHGTPVNMLQIPANVMQTIAGAMQRPKEACCRFTQDGKTVDDLFKNLEPKDKMCLAEKNIEVGWACRRCASVFQAEQLFVSHQRMICQSTESAFKLIQTHYECTSCRQWFGTQVDFKKHCELPPHSSK